MLLQISQAISGQLSWIYMYIYTAIRAVLALGQAVSDSNKISVRIFLKLV